jgi:hypothetical protein
LDQLVVKKGGIVTIKSLEWYNKIYLELIQDGYNSSFLQDMISYCGKTAKIIRVIEEQDMTIYNIDLDNDKWNWSEFMFEGIKEQRKKKLRKLNDRHK